MMTHAEMDQLYELYALGALELDLASEIDSHVADGCEHCLARIHAAVETTAALSVMADPVTPPAEIRRALLNSVRRSEPVTAVKPERFRWLLWATPAFAAGAIACLVLFALSLRKINDLNGELAHVRYERDQLQSAVALLSKEDTRTVQFSKNNEHGPSGSVLVNKSGGIVVVGSKLAELKPGKTYELWAIPAKGAPIPAGTFETQADGDFLHIAPHPVTNVQIAAVAVSVEPAGGSPAPTTKPILVVPVT